MFRKQVNGKRAMLALIALLVTSLGARDGCSGIESSGGGGSGEGGDDTTSTATTTTTGTGGGAPCLLPPPTPSDPITLLFEALHATIEDEAGTPQAGVPIAVCGKGACTTKVQSGDDGTATMMVAPLTLDHPTARWGDGLFWAMYGARIDSPSATIKGTTIHLTDTTIPVEEGATIAIDQLTLSIPKGVYPNFDPFLFDTPEKRTLRVSIVDATVAKLIAPAEGFAMIVNLGPAPTYLCNAGVGAPLATLTINDAAGLEANTTVGFYQFELDGDEHTGELGTWTRVSDGVVVSKTDDAGTKLMITTAEGQGLRLIGAVGIKPEAK